MSLGAQSRNKARFVDGTSTCRKSRGHPKQQSVLFSQLPVKAQGFAYGSILSPIPPVNPPLRRPQLPIPPYFKGNLEVKRRGSPLAPTRKLERTPTEPNLEPEALLPLNGALKLKRTNAQSNLMTPD